MFIYEYAHLCSNTTVYKYMNYIYYINIIYINFIYIYISYVTM